MFKSSHTRRLFSEYCEQLSHVQTIVNSNHETPFVFASKEIGLKYITSELCLDEDEFGRFALTTDEKGWIEFLACED